VKPWKRPEICQIYCDLDLDHYEKEVIWSFWSKVIIWTNRNIMYCNLPESPHLRRTDLFISTFSFSRPYVKISASSNLFTISNSSQVSDVGQPAHTDKSGLSISLSLLAEKTIFHMWPSTGTSYPDLHHHEKDINWSFFLKTIIQTDRNRRRNNHSLLFMATKVVSNNTRQCSERLSYSQHVWSVTTASLQH